MSKLFCAEAAFCIRYFANGTSGIEAAFLVIETDEYQFEQAMAKYDVNVDDFTIFLRARDEKRLWSLRLLVSTDGKYASLMSSKEDERIAMYGTHFRHINIDGNSIDQLLLNFQSLVLADESLFREPGLKVPELKIKNRINYSQIDFNNLEYIVREVRVAIDAPSEAPIDSLALAIFQSNLKMWMSDLVVDPVPLMRELWNRVDENYWNGYHFFDFTGVTPREIVARRGRAEAKLYDLERMLVDFNYGHDCERAENAILKIKGDLLAEVAFLAALRGSPLMKHLVGAVATYGERNNRQIVY
ncbi:MAG: hypothetical protein RL389_328 [Actinomycetota bacterium]